MSDVAAITDTEAAAADLKKKLREALREAGRRDLAAAVDTSRIGTVHAFCLGVLREFALRLARSPGREVLDEAEGAALVAEAAKDTLLAALEAGDLAGLNELLAERSVGDVERWTATLAADADRLAHLAAGHLGPHERTLVALAQRVLAAVRQRLDDRGALDFDAMITLTRDLLRDDAAVRRALQRRVRCLIVDEFQDVDPVQKEIAYLLGEPAGGGPDRTRLMLVGDPKQSVFRFRRADVTVWRAVEREFQEWRAAGRALVVSLEENYRSAQPILGLVEATVGAVLDAPIGGFALADFEVPYERITATAEHRTLEPCVEVIAVAPDEAGKPRRVEAVRSLEAVAVARRARALVDDGARPADIAILLTSWSAMETYREALRAVGLETYALRSEGFHERREVVDLLLALEAINDPNDDRALLGFLRSPFVGLRDETLLAIARAGHSPYWRGLGDAAGTGREPHELPGGEPGLLGRGRALLGRFVGLRDRVPADALLEGLLEESGYVAHLRLLGEERRRAEANVKKFLRLLRRFRATTVGQAIRAIRAQRDSEETREGDAPLMGGARNAITVTSVHSAKGLEWKVVFWCDLVRMGFGRDDADLVISRNLLALRPRNGPDPAQAAYDAAVEAERAELAAEHRRLWYVAATRARERLILSGIQLGAKARADQSPGQAFILKLAVDPHAAAGRLEYTDRDAVTYEAGLTVVGVPQGPELVKSAAPRPVAAAGSLPALLAPMAVSAGRRRHSATELLTFARCARKHWLRYVAGLGEPEVEREGTEFISALRRGQIVHDVLEKLREEAELDLLLEAAIGRWDPEAPAPEGARGQAYRRHLKEEVERVATHPDYRAIADLPTARRELGFVHLLPGGSFTQGAVDLAAMRLDGLALVDVKTSQMSAAAAKQRAADYALQRDVYVAAAEGVSGLPVSEFALQFSRGGVQVPEPVTPAARETIKAELTEAVGAIEGGERSLTTHPWECRYCGYKVAGWCPGVPMRAGQAADA
jgi:ATP-dependent helicase/nuclease subunit A